MEIDIPFRSNEQRQRVSEAGAKVLNFIDVSTSAIFNELQVQPCGLPTIKLRHVTQLSPSHDTQGVLVGWNIRDTEVIYTFPGKSRDEAWRFTCVLRILDEIQSAILQGIVITKRDVFYRDPALFTKQAVVDRYVGDIAHTCKVGREDLNVVASPKGLMAGSTRNDSHQEPQTIPSTVRPTTEVSYGHLQWILVVEKEATFNYLLEQNIHRRKSLGNGLLITAKGYPDLATRSFLRSILEHPTFNGPIFGLVDYDPYGIDILRSYRFGSKTTATNINISIPEMQWMGLKFDDIVSQRGVGEQLMELSEADKQKAHNILCWLHAQNPKDSTVVALQDCREELQRMLMINRKAEIQILQETNDLCHLIERTICKSLPVNGEM